MARYQVRRLSDDEIMYKYDSDSLVEFGSPWNDSELYANESMSQEDIDQDARDEKWAELRKQRDAKLLDVDKARYEMVWSDQTETPMSQQDRDAWVAYRQALLDVPANVEDIDELDLSTMAWPEKP